MSAWTMTDLRIGRWSALAIFVIGVVYVLTGAAGLVLTRDVARRDPLQQVDPYLATLELLIILAAIFMVVMMGAVHAYAPREAKTYSLVALGFMLLMAVVTISVHFVQLTVVRRIEFAGAPPLSRIFFTEWPSVMFALDLLAWDLFLGLSLLCAAQVFKGAGLLVPVRVSMILSGVLCLAGLIGPASGDLRFQILGIIGYAGVFPVACLLLARCFARLAVSEGEID